MMKASLKDELAGEFRETVAVDILYL